MPTQDRAVSIHPYFRILDGKMDEFKEFCERFVSITTTESKCLYYGFSFNGNQVHCREGYDDAEGLLAHLQQQFSPLEKQASTSVCSSATLQVGRNGSHGSLNQSPSSGVARKPYRRPGLLPNTDDFSRLFSRSEKPWNVRDQAAERPGHLAEQEPHKRAPAASQ